MIDTRFEITGKGLKRLDVLFDRPEVFSEIETMVFARIEFLDEPTVEDIVRSEDKLTAYLRARGYSDRQFLFGQIEVRRELRREFEAGLIEVV